MDKSAENILATLNWLLNNRTFVPSILEWRRHCSIPYRLKLTAITLMAATLSISIVFFFPMLKLQIALAICGIRLGATSTALPRVTVPPSYAP